MNSYTVTFFDRQFVIFAESPRKAALQFAKFADLALGIVYAIDLTDHDLAVHSYLMTAVWANDRKEFRFMG